MKENKNINFLSKIICFAILLSACKWGGNIDIHKLTIEQLVSEVKEGKITSTELVKICVENHKKNKNLNAFTLFLDQEVLKKAKKIDSKVKNGEQLGKLAGIPFSVKDNIFTKGIETTAASNALRGHIPKVNSQVVQRLLDEDAILIGKTNMHELAFGITGLNGSYGYVKNPLDTTKIAGGSSSGTAVSVAVRSSVFGLGTDTGGSTRIPPALTGLFGFRPTIERYGNSGLIRISKTRDVHGLIADKMDDIIYLDNIISGIAIEENASIKNSTYRIGFPKEYYRENLSAEVNRLLEKSVKKLKNAGFIIVEKDIKGIKGLNEAVSFPVVLYETKIEIKNLLASLNHPMTEDEFIQKIGSPDVKQIFEMIFGENSILEEVYKNAVGKHREILVQTIKSYFEENDLDAIMFPLTLLEAASIKEAETANVTLNGEKLPAFLTYINNTDSGSNSNMPGITIPIGLTKDGLAVGLGLDALTGYDRELLDLSKKITVALK